MHQPDTLAHTEDLETYSSLYKFLMDARASANNTQSSIYDIQVSGSGLKPAKFLSKNLKVSLDVNIITKGPDKSWYRPPSRKLSIDVNCKPTQIGMYNALVHWKNKYKAKDAIDLYCSTQQTRENCDHATYPGPTQIPGICYWDDPKAKSPAI